MIAILCQCVSWQWRFLSDNRCKGHNVACSFVTDFIDSWILSFYLGVWKSSKSLHQTHFCIPTSNIHKYVYFVQIDNWSIYLSYYYINDLTASSVCGWWAVEVFGRVVVFLHIYWFCSFTSIFVLNTFYKNWFG